MNNKLISFAAAAATLFAFAACNKDANQIDVVTPGTGTYAKVSISMGTPGTRAEDGGYDAGTPDEAKVNSIMLVVYGEANGKISNEVVGYGSTGKPGDPADREDESYEHGSVSDTYEKVIELTMMPGKSKEHAKYVVAYVNVANELLAFDKAMDETTDVIKEGVNFIMTNAATGTNKENDWKVATKIADRSLYSSPEAAAAGTDKTTIYVERLAAKVTVSNNTTDEKATADIDIVGVDEKPYKLVFKAANAVWAPTGTAPEMYKLKNQWTEDLTWANAGADRDNENNVDNEDNLIKDTRNFWAKGFYYELDNQKGPDFTGILKYVSSNELRRTDASKGDIKGKDMGASDYTTEHTYGWNVVNHTDYNAVSAATSAIVLGKYEVAGENFNDFKKGNDFDFYLLLNKVSDKEYYTIFNEAQLIQYLFEAKNPVLYTEKDLEKKFNASLYYNTKWYSEDKQYGLVDSEEADDLPTLYKYDETNKDFVEYDINLNPINLTAKTNARHYNLGYAYFFAPIEHLVPVRSGDKVWPKAVGQYGVVRNHSYQLTVNSIKSLGAPLDDDHFGTDPNNPTEPEDPGDKPIIPDPDETALIRAELKVLSWHVVSQGVDL